MDYKYINQLLDRYWKGETSLEEEEILRSFFSQKDVPAGLKEFQVFFQYQQTEPKNDALGEDFDERILTMIDEPKPVKAKVISMKQRLMPLFKAAAIVAIILTLGNAIQVPFNKSQNNPASNVAGNVPTMKGETFAMGDSTSLDTLKHSNLVSPNNEKNIVK